MELFHSSFFFIESLLLNKWYQAAYSILGLKFQMRFNENENNYWTIPSKIDRSDVSVWDKEAKASI